MTQLMIEVPDVLVALPTEERNELIRTGLHQAVQGLGQRLKQDIAISRAKIQWFETHYGMTLAQFETDLLPQAHDWQTHDNYNDWFYWQTLWQQKTQMLSLLQQIRVI
jgi:hypothetical protein